MPIGNPLAIFIKAFSPVGAVITETVTNNKIFAGETFGLAQRFDLANGAFIDFIFDTTSVSSDFVIFLPWVIGAAQAGPMTVDIYEDTVYTGGNAVPLQNRDLTSTNTAEMSVVTGATITNIGTVFPWQYSVFSNGIPATASAGSEGGPSLPLNVGPGKVLTLRLTNDDPSTTAHCTLAFDWFEFDKIE